MKRNTINTRKGFTLVEMLGVLAIIAILISVIAVGVMSAINRARIVATVSNIKNLETAAVGFIALPNTGGTVPLTEGGTVVRTWATGTPPVFALAASTNYTLDQALRASGLIERPMTWRIGKDGMIDCPISSEATFVLSRNAFAVAGETVNGVTTVGGQDWSGHNRTECAPITANLIPIAAGASVTELPVVGNGAAVESITFYLDGVSPLTGSRCAFVILRDVSLKDANKLSAELNGSLDNSELTPRQQFVGRVIYDADTVDTSGTDPVVTTSPSVDVFVYLGAF